MVCVEGGVAIDGRDDLPEGHAKFTDKLIGKTQKVCSHFVLVLMGCSSLATPM